MVAPIVFFGGSFDPVHAGHLHCARVVQKLMQLHSTISNQPIKKLDNIAVKVPPQSKDLPVQIEFVPCHSHPQSKTLQASAEQRLAMLHHASKDTSFRVNDIEIQRSGISYTYDTVLALRAAYGKHRSLCWLLGADAYHSFLTWHRWEDIKANVHLLVYGRHDNRALAPTDTTILPQHDQLKSQSTAGIKNIKGLQPCNENILNALFKLPAGLEIALDGTAYDCSSQQIRDALLNGDALKDKINKSVLQYIRDHKLYGLN